MKKYSITYRIGNQSWTVEAHGFDKAQQQVAQIMNAGGEIVVIQARAMVREIIDYTLSRKGHRQYLVTDEDGEILPESGSWKTLTACKKRIEELGLVYTGTVTVNQNYKHWAGFKPVKEGKMADEMD